MAIIAIPNFQKIIKPTWKHKPGYGISSVDKRSLSKQKIAHQGTLPSDKSLLGKLGIIKKDKVLAIAGYYADWASAIKNLGADVDYSDVSGSMVNYVKKKLKTRFGNYIHKGYEFLPKKSGEYDWTFTYEACGGKQGLPIAYIRSLMNNKGGILMVFKNVRDPKSIGSKLETYPSITNTISKVYNADKKIQLVDIRARRKNEEVFENKPYVVCNILTNNSAREKAESDLKVLKYLSGKNIINLKKESKKLSVTESSLHDSLNRLSKLTKLFDKEFIKEIRIK